MKNLENYGVVSLDAREIMDIDGGLLLAAACIGLAALYLYSQTACLYKNGKYQF